MLLIYIKNSPSSWNCNVGLTKQLPPKDFQSHYVSPQEGKKKSLLYIADYLLGLNRQKICVMQLLNITYHVSVTIPPQGPNLVQHQESPQEGWAWGLGLQSAQYHADSTFWTVDFKLSGGREW